MLEAGRRALQWRGVLVPPVVAGLGARTMHGMLEFLRFSLRFTTTSGAHGTGWVYANGHGLHKIVTVVLPCMVGWRQ